VTASHGLELVLAGVSVATALIGLFVAWLFYCKKPGTAAAIAEKAKPLYGLVAHKFYVDEIYQAILTCMNDDFYFNDLVNKAVLSKLQTKRQVRQFYPSPIKFSEKEIRILKLLAEDKTTEEISKEVFLSTRTIETIRQNMKTKIGAKTIAGLIMYAMRNKIID